MSRQAERLAEEKGGLISALERLATRARSDVKKSQRRLPQPNESDDEYTGWYVLLYLGLFLLFAIGGASNSERAHPIRSGAIGGAGAALMVIAMVIAMIMLTFVVVDNLFLDVVSQQIDKLNAFHAQTTSNSMRDFINGGLLRGTVIVLPVVAVVGGFLGAFASQLRRRFTATAPAVA